MVVWRRHPTDCPLVSTTHRCHQPLRRDIWLGPHVRDPPLEVHFNLRFAIQDQYSRVDWLLQRYLRNLIRAFRSSAQRSILPHARVLPQRRQLGATCTSYRAFRTLPRPKPDLHANDDTHRDHEGSKCMLAFRFLQGGSWSVAARFRSPSVFFVSIHCSGFHRSTRSSYPTCVVALCIIIVHVYRVMHFVPVFY